MRPRAYPLEAARTVRGIARDRAADAWAEALRELAAATARRERAAERLRALRARPLPDAKEEGTAADLQRVVLYRERRREEEEALREELSRASAEERRAAAAVAEARAALERASAEAEVIERHRERWARAQAREGGDE